MTRRNRRGKKKTNGELVSENQDEVFDEGITLEILSRLPVKSLLRFKCVCKRWRSIIRKDQFFIDLHLSRSITAERPRTSFLIVANPINRGSGGRMFSLSAELLLPSDDENGCVEVGGSIRLWEPPVPKTEPISLCSSLNGLICFMEKKRYCARVYNISTRESTPWIKSTIKQHEDKILAEAEEVFQEEAFQDDEELIGHQELMFSKHALGYDPGTKEHKVVALWEIYSYGYPASVFFWEVMTVGHNYWRRIDGIDPYICEPTSIRGSVYINGSIYWLIQYEDDHYFYSSIVEFSVGSEKFRLVKELERDSCSPCSFGTELAEVNGQLCVLIFDDLQRKSIKMRTLYDLDENVQDPASCNYQWVEKTIMIPELPSIRGVRGSYLFIIRSTDDGFTIYHYNQKNKSYYAVKKIDTEISSKLKDEDGKVLYDFEYDVFTPSLFPVN